MPTSTFKTLGIAGLRSPTGPPGSMGAYEPDPDVLDSFTAHVTRLTEEYGAATRPAFYLDEEADEVVQASGHRMNINPAWEGEGLADAPKDDAAWATVSDEYEPVNADAAYDPLADAINDRGVSPGAFGAWFLYRNGGEVHADLFLPDMAFTLEAADVERELIPGLQTGYSHYADQNVYAEPIVLDPTTGAVYRHLADKRTRRHVKPAASESGTTVAEVTAWWAEELDRLENLGDALIQTIQEASDYTVTFSDVPFMPADFYTALGFPESLADSAADLLVPATEHSAWDLFHAATRVLARDYEGKLDGGALRRHFRNANDILFRPPTAEERAIDAWRDRDEANQNTINGDTVDDLLAARAGSLTDAADQYRSLRARLKDLAEDAEEAPA